jgi:hypothetical protein
VPQAGVGGQDPDQPAHGGAQFAQALVIARLAGQAGEQAGQVLAGMPQPAGLAGEPEQGLHHRQGDQLGVRDLRADPDCRPPRRSFWRGLQQVISTDVEFGGEGVQVGVHENLRVRRWVATPILGTHRLKQGANAGSHPLELII